MKRDYSKANSTTKLLNIHFLMIALYKSFNVQKLSCKTSHKIDEWNHLQIPQTINFKIPPCA